MGAPERALVVINNVLILYCGNADGKKCSQTVNDQNHLTFMDPCIVKNVLIYIQKEATLRNLFYLETALHISVGTTTHHQERKQLYLQYLSFVTPLLLPAAIVEVLELV
jgi:hypothetical protein